MEETPARESTTRRSRVAKQRKSRDTPDVPFVKKTPKNVVARKAAPVSGPVTRSAFHGFVSVQARGILALPSTIRKRYGLDKPGAQIELTEREDGVLELRPTIAVPASEAWFWDERWQEGEREVEAQIAAGLGTVHQSVEEFMAHLEKLDEEATAEEARKSE